MTGKIKFNYLSGIGRLSQSTSRLNLSDFFHFRHHVMVECEKERSPEELATFEAQIWREIQRFADIADKACEKSCTRDKSSEKSSSRQEHFAGARRFWLRQYVRFLILKELVVRHIFQ